MKQLKNLDRDPRYEIVKTMIDNNYIKSFKEIFSLIPKTIIAVQMRTNNNRMSRLIKHPLQLALWEVDKLASLFGCTPTRLIELIRAQK
jgi:hypothetical protein